MNIKTTSFPCGGPQLSRQGHKSAAAVGLSLNGFVCVALDAYLSAAVPPSTAPHLLKHPLHFPQQQLQQPQQQPQQQLQQQLQQ